MGDKITLKVESREAHGKKVAQIRRQGLTPGIVYGPDMEPVSVQSDSVELQKVIVKAGRHTPVHLTGIKKSRIAMIKSVDVDPARNVIRHVGFHAVNVDEPVIAEVPIRLVGEGESEAERAGLVVLQALESLEVRSLPLNLPDALEVSILGLTEAGDRVTVADIKMPEGVEIVERDDGREQLEGEEEEQTVMDLVIANVYEPGALQAANEAAAGDAEEDTLEPADADGAADSSEAAQSGDAKTQDEAK